MRRPLAVLWLVSLLALAGGVAQERPVAAQSAISADGAIESKSGGFKFPDGSVQLAAATPEGECPTLDPSDEMIWVGGVCIDKDEASIWDAPVGGNQIIGTSPEDYCDRTGQNCDSIYARSVAGVEPALFITWFQAQQALANSGKRLPTNAEWQMAARGTPDDTGQETTPCNTRSERLQNTGASPGCVSDWGAFDMVGNVWEWVADWVPASTTCVGWGSLSDDFMCLAGASTTATGPGAIIRGGWYSDGSSAGPLAIWGLFQPNLSGPGIGFRGAR
jgi:formylglycine-generating enzyme required for sulfatase activity